MAKNNAKINKLTLIWNSTETNKQIHTTKHSTKGLNKML